MHKPSQYNISNPTINDASAGLTSQVSTIVTFVLSSYDNTALMGYGDLLHKITHYELSPEATLLLRAGTVCTDSIHRVNRPTVSFKSHNGRWKEVDMRRYETESTDKVVSTPTSYSVSPRKNLDLKILTENFRGFLQSLQGNTTIVH